MKKNWSWKEGVYSDGSSDFLSHTQPALQDRVTFKVRIPVESPVDSVHFWGSQKGTPFLKPMKLDSSCARFRTYRVKKKLEGRVLRYCFVLLQDGNFWIYNQAGLFDYIPSAEHEFRLLANFDCPDWVYGRTFYQIFPDRFCNGNPELTPRTGQYSFHGHQVIRRDWDSKPLEYQEGRCLDFYGGDLCGIEQKLSYLKSLGVDALYLNPIFHAPSHHKYDCQDFENVDPHFGGNQDLEKLMSTCKLHDFRVILDISVNHVGSSHIWFNREERYGKKVGAYHDPACMEAEFFIRSGSQFHQWAGVDELLTLNYLSSSLRDRIYRKEDSILKKWLKKPYEIDGWRFDVGHCMAREGNQEMYREVWGEIRTELKALGANFYLMAEFWEDPEEFLQGDMWDACMNYFGFLRPVRAFLGEKDWFLKSALGKKRGKVTGAATLERSLRQSRAKLPFQIQNLQFNLLNSHDIHRFFHLQPFQFSQHRLCAILLMTYPGVPSIFYGDEQEISGHIRTNEGCRFPLPWNESNESSRGFHLYSVLARFRKQSEVLGYGGYLPLLMEAGIFAYARFLKGECVLCVVSNETEPREVTLPIGLVGTLISNSFEELFGHHKTLEVCEMEISVTVPPGDGLIFSNLNLVFSPSFTRE
jgi:alpha-glucosidase